MGKIDIYNIEKRENIAATKLINTVDCTDFGTLYSKFCIEKLE